MGYKIQHKYIGATGKKQIFSETFKTKKEARDFAREEEMFPGMQESTLSFKIFKEKKRR